MSRPEDSPWAVSVAQVAARAGRSRQVDADFPAPDGIGDTICGVKEGAPVHVSGSFDSIVDGLIFNGHVRAPLHAECVRCLTPISRDLDLDVVAFFPYTPPEEKYHGKEEFVVGEDEEAGEEYPLAEGGAFADLEALLRDELVDALPVKPLCRPDCKGLCPQCGINLNEHPDHHHEVTDFRWSALEEIKRKLGESPEEPGQEGGEPGR